MDLLEELQESVVSWMQRCERLKSENATLKNEVEWLQGEVKLQKEFAEDSALSEARAVAALKNREPKSKHKSRPKPNQKSKMIY